MRLHATLQSALRPALCTLCTFLSRHYEESGDESPQLLRVYPSNLGWDPLGAQGTPSSEKDLQTAKGVNACFMHEIADCMMQSATRESKSRVSESKNPDPRSQTPDFRTFKARYQGTGMLAKCACMSFTVGASNLQSAAGALSWHS